MILHLHHCQFCSLSRAAGLAPSSIQTYMSGIRQLQISHGLKDPEIHQMPRLCQVMRGRTRKVMKKPHEPGYPSHHLSSERCEKAGLTRICHKPL